MGAQLQHTPHPGAALQPVRPTATPRRQVRALQPRIGVTPRADPQGDPRSVAPDPDRGLGLLMSFVGALSVMVADVVLIGAVAESWILIPGFVVLLVMTAIVFAEIMSLLADGEGTAPDAC